MRKIRYFQNPDLPGSDIDLPGNKKVGVLLIHGFTATTTEVRELAFFLNSTGLAVKAPLLPGHGTSYQDLNTKKFTDWTQFVEEEYKKIAGQKENVIVGGESMGAVLSLYLAIKFQSIRALLLYSPALIIKNINYAKLLSIWLNMIPKKKSNDNLLWQGYTVYPLKALVELRKLQTLVKQKINNVQQPILICQGKLDQTIDSENANYIYSNVSSNIKQVEYFKNSSHVMIMDKDKKAIFNTTYRFLYDQQIL